jgi:hypothetical protein
MPEEPQKPEYITYRHLYWAFQNIEGAKHPEELDWDTSPGLRANVRHVVQRGFEVHEGPRDPDECDHPETAANHVSVGHDGYRLSYMYCGQCGCVLSPYGTGKKAEEDPLLCKKDVQ